MTKMSLVSADLLTDPVTITVTAIDTADGALTVTVSPRVVTLPPGAHVLQWSMSPDSTGWVIAGIGGGGVAADVDQNNVWSSPFVNALKLGDLRQYFPYTIYLTKTYANPAIVARIGVDPVIENDPPS